MSPGDIKKNSTEMAAMDFTNPTLYGKGKVAFFFPAKQKVLFF